MPKDNSHFERLYEEHTRRLNYLSRNQKWREEIDREEEEKILKMCKVSYKKLNKSQESKVIQRLSGKD